MVLSQLSFSGYVNCLSSETNHIHTSLSNKSKEFIINNYICKMSPSIDSIERCDALLSDYEDDDSYNKKTPASPLLSSSRTQSVNYTVISFLLISLMINVAQFLLSIYPAIHVNYQEPPSKYAQLTRSHKEPYVFLTEYATENETVQDQAWMSISDDIAVVALSDDFAGAHDLRKAQRFPWDHTKGLYILHGVHNLHCLKNIYISLKEYRRGVEQTRSWHHISHCLDTLRRQIVCDADDTPRATDRRPEVVAGLGQYRMCRSWDALEAFAKRHTACYKRPENAEWDGQKKIDRFKHCPPGSGYVVTDNYVPPDEIMVGLPTENVGYTEN